jgi:O-methyltransferase
MNRFLKKLRIPFIAGHHFDGLRDMLSLEQAGNLQVLLMGVLDHGVAGDVVEFGCHTGSTTTVLAQVLLGSCREGHLHVYDHFDDSWTIEKNTRRRLEANFRTRQLPIPHVHAGNVLDTVPGELPERIAFAHLDLGTGGDAALLQHVVLHVLTHLYPRLSQHGILLIMDYHPPDPWVACPNRNSGITEACNDFFADKPDTVRVLYGGPCSHAYVRKR